MNNKPNFFIVGAAKSGTSSLWQYLKGHPEIFMPEDELYKEPRHFSHPGRFPTEDDYLQLFAAAQSQHKRIGEASTAYLTHPDCAGKIFQFQKDNNLDVKIIILLRNPVNRAYSMYNWMAQEGYEYSATFGKALKREKKRIHKMSKFWEPNYYYNYLYFNSGLYTEQVNRYFETFGRENVYVGVFEEFTKNTAGMLKEILQFLEVDPNYSPDVSKVYNPSYKIIHPGLQFLLRWSNKILSRFNIVKFTNKKERDRLLQIGYTKQKTPPQKDEIKRELAKAYEADIRKLEILINKDLSIWLNAVKAKKE
ncbi:sulfotransferase [Fulvivirgaceae bacterium BMA12]|uniref:Sulfotransferase n=1 Tax=Agaribacillus aureus TaxID=3051825 RepID=A0ABT8L936_9BACT|nr:sulfotransferase [Fulvivirgaceae bacterium BMA12]